MDKRNIFLIVAGVFVIGGMFTSLCVLAIFWTPIQPIRERNKEEQIAQVTPITTKEAPTSTPEPTQVITEEPTPTKEVQPTGGSLETYEDGMDWPIKNSWWDGSVKQVSDYLEKNLNDWESYESIEWGPVGRWYSDETKLYSYAVMHKYRAKNSLGGTEIHRQMFWMDEEGNVFSVIPVEN